MTAPHRRRIEVKEQGDITIINFKDNKILDEQIIQKIGEDLFSLVDEMGRKKIILNFGNVDYMSSVILKEFIALNKKCQATGGRLVFCNMDRDIYDTFEITKLNKLFHITQEEEQALQVLSVGQDAGGQKGSAAGGQSPLDRLKQERKTPEGISI